MAITAYATLSAPTAAALDVLVAAAILAGQQPFGPPSVIGGNRQSEPLLFAQTMVAGSQVLVGSTGSTGATGATGAAGSTFSVKTTTERDALTPAEGDTYYNSTTKKLNFYNGTAWAAVTSV